MKLALTLTTLLASVGVALAANPTPQTVSGVFNGFITGNVLGLFPAMLSIALVTFLVGMVRFIKAGGDEEARLAGRQVMLYGIIVLFVMVSFWGIVKLLTVSFFEDDPGIPNFLPTLSV